MKAGDLDLKNMLEFKTAEGRLVFGTERMLIFRQDAFGALRELLFEQVGERHAKALLTQFGYRCGRGDYDSLCSTYEWDSEMDRIASGPVLHTWEGIVHAEPTLLEFDRSSGSFHMKGVWRNSYEAELHVARMGVGEEAVCHTLAGYASGWAEGFFGAATLAVETMCVGKGDSHCEFEIRDVDSWGYEVDEARELLKSTPRSVARELEDKITTIQEQAAAIRELSTPVMEIWDDVLVLPVVGVVDTRRSMEIMNTLLARIVETQSRCVIIDITGVEVVDTKTADYLLKVSRAANLLGTRCVLTGLSPAVAQTLVEIGADLTEVRTLRNLKDGLKDCLRFLSKSKSAGADSP